MSDDPTRRAPRPRDDDETRFAAAPHDAADPGATRRIYTPADATRPAEPHGAQGGGDDDPFAALERLQSLGTPADGFDPGSPPSDEPRGRIRRPRSGGGRRERPRPAARAGGLPLGRILAPAVFLVAVIVLLILVFQSGVVTDNGKPSTSVASTPAATKTTKASNSGSNANGNGSTTGTSSSATKTYKVKAGDTPSGIASKYGISVSDLQDLNPDVNFSTLNIGEKLKVPRQ